MSEVSLDAYNTPHSGMYKQKVEKRLQKLEDEVEVIKSLLKVVFENKEQNNDQ
jgi:hypothetical protein